MSDVLDLRGREFTVPPAAVLADPSGRRARLLARGGRVLVLVALLWVAGLVLAGLGVLPAKDVPFGHAVAGPQAPSGWRHLPKPTPPTAQELSPATPANSDVAGTSGNRDALQQAAKAATGQPSGSSLAAAGQTGAPSTSGSAPLRTAAGTAVGTGSATTGAVRGNSASAPGRTDTTTRGSSPAGPGQLRQTITPAGKSGTAPGRTSGTAGTAAIGHTKLS